MIEQSQGTAIDKKESVETIKLTINGTHYELTTGDDIEPWESLSYDVYPWDKLLHTLREKLGLTGTKSSCDRGACGACSVLIDGRLALSCLVLTVDCNGKEITTIEGLSDPVTGKLHPVQEAFIENNAAQCGFCTPGMIIATKALLDRNPDPAEKDVKWALAGNICRCGNYSLISQSVMAAAEKMRDERTK
ncbi:MAG TPA: (2Fe-2S)-binding protein [Acidobacteriota bacterium]|nr:(2Fe-2S)-binding protein [Acidobacteriota bacterium]